MNARRSLTCSLVFIYGAMIMGCGGRDQTAILALTHKTMYSLAWVGTAPIDVYINDDKQGSLSFDSDSKSFSFKPKLGLNTITLCHQRSKQEWNHTFLIKPQETYSVNFTLDEKNGFIINSRSDSDKPPAADVVKEAELNEHLLALNTELLAFTKEHVPELHAAIDQIDQDWKDREVRCEKLAVELRRLRRDPMNDPDLKRWRTAITEMKEHLVELRKQREEAYIAFKKFDLAPSGKAEYERKLRMAKKAATDSQDYHKKMQERLESK